MCFPLPNLTKSIDILCSRCETHWLIWFGHPTYYHHLPFFGSGFDPWPYDLYQSLPPRPRQLTIDLGVGDSVAGWVSVVGVITVDNGLNSQEAMDTMTVGGGKKKVFRMVTVALHFMSMVVKLVWQ